MKTKKYTMAEIIADNGETEILTVSDFGKKAMTKSRFNKLIFTRFSVSQISEIIYS